MVVRDHYGDIVGAVCLKLLHVRSPKIIKALASRAACELEVNFFMESWCLFCLRLIALW